MQKIVYAVFLIAMISISPIMTQGTELTRNLPGIDLITRSQWGADETMRLTSHPVFQSILISREKYKRENELLKQTNFDAWLANEQKAREAKKIEDARNGYLLKDTPKKFSINKTQATLDTNPLRRPQSYHTNKTEILIHHTAAEVPIDDVIIDEQAELKRIYAFHTQRQGRGDIGYNFIIGPSGKIYEGRAGGPGVIGAHAKYNNNSSIGISLMGNFDLHDVPPAQYEALVNLSIAVAKYYNINPLDQARYFKSLNTAPYMSQNTSFTIAGHKDAGWTACPGAFLYAKLPTLRNSVAAGIASNTLFTLPPISNTAPLATTTPLASPLRMTSSQRQKALLLAAKTYMDNGKNLPKATKLTQKNSNAPNINDIPTLIQNPVSVFLREASMQASWIVSCAACKIRIDASDFSLPATLGIALSYNQATQQFSVRIGEHTITAKTIEFIGQTANSRIIINSYARKSFAGIPRNAFVGTLTFRHGMQANKEGAKAGAVLVNTLSLDQYLQGVVEANDQESQEYNNLMAILTKSYMLYYLDGGNRHPSIPAGETYNAIDDPDYFQKYAGIGVQDTLTRRNAALTTTRQLRIHHNNHVGIFPYFSCSAGFTLPALAQRGRTDTPYLTSVYDPAGCKDFAGHGVGLAGAGARALIDQGSTYRDVLAYFYPGVQFFDQNRTSIAQGE